MGLRLLHVSTLAAILGVGSAASGADQEPRFVEGDPASLACRIVKTEPASKAIEASILTIEVKNAGRVTAEPVRFELRGKGSGASAALRTLRRVPDPTNGRAGRTVAAGGTQTYLISVAVGARDLAGATARVTAASFLEGEGAKSPPVVVESVLSDRVVDHVGAAVWETTVRLRNEADATVDATFLATCTAPDDARLLVGRRLAPRESVSWVLRDVPLGLHEPLGPSITGFAAKKLQIVDWSILRADGVAAGASALEAAWTRWLRWDEPHPNVRGRFAYRFGRDGQSPDKYTAVAGTFSVGADGAVVANPDAAVDPDSRAKLVRAIGEAFADLRRGPAAKAVNAAKPCLLDLGRVTRVLAESPPTGESGPPAVWLVEDDVFQGWEDPSGPGIAEKWITAPLAGAYVVTTKALVQAGIGGGKRPCDERRYAYAITAGRVAPTRYARAEAWSGGAADQTTLDLSEIVFDGGADPPFVVDAPAGLREAWDGPYRYPDRPVDLTTRFVAENPGTDAMWQGERRVTGRMTLVGFTGMRPEESRWAKADVQIDGKFDEEKRKALVAILVDRLVLWARRDFAGTKLFDVLFRGARFAPRAGRPGVFDVTNGPCATIEVKDGRVVGWDSPGLDGGQFGWERVGMAIVRRSLRRDLSGVEARFADLGRGWIVPTEMRFERVLGADWGPEKITLTETKVVPSGRR